MTAVSSDRQVTKRDAVPATVLYTCDTLVYFGKGFQIADWLRERA
jgi:hypothetical protein